MTLAEQKDAAAKEIVRRRDELIALSHRLHDDPEIAFREDRASAALADALEEAGFAVQRGVAGLPTAFVAEFGTSETTIAICCEYDALPRLGHACGHNVIAASGLGGALGLAVVAAEAGIRVLVVGCPAEERGGGKILLARAGVFDGVTAAMMVHPHRHFCVDFTSYALDDLEIEFIDRRGQVSAAAPSLVADAVSGMALTAIGFLRQEISPRSRLFARIGNGDPDGLAPLERSVLQVRWLCDTIEEQDQVLAAVRERCSAVATACGFDVQIREGHPRYAPVVTAPGLAAAFAANGLALGFGDPIAPPAHAATDMGNVSRVVPTVHAVVPALPHDGPLPHSAAFAEAMVAPRADETIIRAATALAWTALDAAADPAIVTQSA
ncbi:MAG: amidohydrolase [Protaetiibacter sp.]